MITKKLGLWILALIVAMGLNITGLAESAGDTADPAPVSEREALVALFDEYSLAESKEAADAILERLQMDLLGFLSALAAVENQEQVLMLVGTMGDEATPDGTTISELMEAVGKLPLNHCEREILDFVLANMQAVY